MRATGKRKWAEWAGLVSAWLLLVGAVQAQGLAPCPTVLSVSVTDQTALCAGKPVTLMANVPNVPFGNWYWTLDGRKLGYDQQTYLTATDPGVYSLGGDWERSTCFTPPTALTLTFSPAAAVTITLSPASVTICEGETTTLSARTGTQTGYSWLRNGVSVPNSLNRPTLTVGESGTYSLSGLSGACTTLQREPVVLVNPLPVVRIVPSRTAFCEGETAQLDAQTDPDNTLRWQRNGTDIGTARSYTASVAATYSLIATRPGGCSQSATYAFTPTVHPLPIFALRPVPAGGLRPGESASTAPDNPAFRYQWEPTEGVSDPTAARPVFTPAQATWYRLTITSEAGCQYVDNLYIPAPTVPVPVVPSVATRLHFPTAFSPNDDGQNDTWAPINLDQYPDADLRIFSRSGELIFAAQPGQPAFDGRYNGAALPSGPYAYHLRIPSQQAEWRGMVLLVR